MFDFTKGLLYRITHISRDSYKKQLGKKRDTKVTKLAKELGISNVASDDKTGSSSASPKLAVVQQHNEAGKRDRIRALIAEETDLTSKANYRMERFLAGYEFLSSNKNKDQDNDNTKYEISPCTLIGIKSYHDSKANKKGDVPNAV